MESGLTVQALVGLCDSEIDDRVASATDTELEALLDEFADRLRGRLSDQFDHDGFVLRLVVVERRDVFERDIEYRSGTWSCRPSSARTPNVVSRWQGIAPLARCENNELRAQSPVLVGLCEVEGSKDDQDAVTRALALCTDDPLGRTYLWRPLSDAELLAELERVDLMPILHAVSEVGAEVSVLSGRAARSSQEVVTQFEVKLARKLYCTQTVSSGEEWTVHDEVVANPTYVIRVHNPVDFGRLCTGEATLIELIASGKVELVGDLSVFARTS